MGSPTWLSLCYLKLMRWAMGCFMIYWWNPFPTLSASTCVQNNQSIMLNLVFQLFLKYDIREMPFMEKVNPQFSCFWSMWRDSALFQLLLDFKTEWLHCLYLLVNFLGIINSFIMTISFLVRNRWYWLIVINPGKISLLTSWWYFLMSKYI